MINGKKESVLRDKSYKFALSIIEVYKHLTSEQREFVLSKQVLRSGTSIGANIEEADGAQSKKDFLHKISIAYKETRETKYWLRLLKDSHYLNETIANELIIKVEELCKIMVAIIKTTKLNLSSKP
jgi:four helix bundle protein